MKKMEDRGSRTDYIATVFDFFWTAFVGDL